MAYHNRRGERDFFPIVVASSLKQHKKMQTLALLELSSRVQCSTELGSAKVRSIMTAALRDSHSSILYPGKDKNGLNEFKAMNISASIL